MGSNRYRREPGGGHRRTSAPPAPAAAARIIGSALESSNVDIAQEFTQMILAQRGYQANSRSITVADEILVETLSAQAIGRAAPVDFASRIP